MRGPSPFSRHDLNPRRDSVRRSLLRANTAVGIVLIAVLGLALAAVLASGQASRSQERALAAERTAQETLWRAYLSQAQAARLTTRRGRRLQSLSALRNAAIIRASVSLRDEAIAALACLDLEVDGPVHSIPLPYRQAFQFGLRHYAISASDGEVVVYRTSDHAEVHKLTKARAGLPPTALLSGFEFTRDGRYLVVFFKDGALVVWDLETAQPALVRPAAKTYRTGNVSTTDDGRLCLAERLEGEARVSLIDVRSGATRTLPTSLNLRGASLRPHASQLALSVGREVQLWDTNLLAKAASYVNPSEIGAAVWSSDGMRFAVGTASGSVFLWDMANGQCQSLGGHTEPLRSLIFSPDNTLLLTAAWDNTTRLWEVRSGHSLLTCEGELGSDFSEDGQRIGFARLGTGVGIWRLESSAVLRTLQPWIGVEAKVRHFDLSGSGRWLAAVVNGDVHLWDLARTAPATIVTIGDVATVTFHPDEQSILLCRSGGLEFRRLETDPASPLPVVGPPRGVNLPDGSRPRQATISLNGRTILVEWENLSFTIVDAQGERPSVALTARQWWWNSLTPASGTGSGRTALSPDGRWAAVGYSVGPTNYTGGMSVAQRAGVWDTQTGHLVFRPEAFGGVTFSPDNRWLILRSDAGCHRFRVGTWEEEREIPLENLASHIGSIAMSLKDSLLVTSRSRQTVQLLDAATGTEYARLLSPVLHSVTRLRCNLDGSRLIVGTADDRILLWDIGALRAELKGLGLDWGISVREPALAGRNGATRSSLLSTPAVLGGLVGATVAVALGLLVLHWHRQLIQRFLRTEATVERRNDQLELAKVELLQAEKMRALGTLAAGIAHDFNNLLSVIRMSNHLIPRARGRREVDDYVATIEKAVLQGKAVVGSMLGYSREPSLEEQPWDVSTLVEQTALLLSSEFLNGIQLDLRLDRATPPVCVSQGKLQQALLNLVVNAAEAMNGSGTLVLAVCPMPAPAIQNPLRMTLRPRAAPAYVQITVADSGPGISPEIINRIFEPFFTTKSSGTRRGTGLGLSLVHTVATQEGLGLAVRSEQRRGTEFFLFLPAGDGSGVFAAPNEGNGH